MSGTINVHIRWMIRRDVPEVLDIENRSFEFPWVEEDLIRCLRQRNCIGMVAEHAERVVGFMIYNLHKSRLEVLNFAIHPDFRRCGVGQQMVNKLVLKLNSNRRSQIVLALADFNLDGQLFFRAMGFRATKVLWHHNHIGGDDYQMEYRLSWPDESPADNMARNGGVNRIARLFPAV